MDADLAALMPQVERNECCTKHVPTARNPQLNKVLALIFLRCTDNDTSPSFINFTENQRGYFLLCRWSHSIETKRGWTSRMLKRKRHPMQGLSLMSGLQFSTACPITELKNCLLTRNLHANRLSLNLHQIVPLYSSMGIPL